MKTWSDGYWLLLLLFMSCRVEVHDVGDLGNAAKVLQELSVVLECDDNRVAHRVSEPRVKVDLCSILSW